MTTTETLFKSIRGSALPSYYGEGILERQTALQKFVEVGLPTSKSEEYRFTPITKTLEKKLNWEISTPASTISSVESLLIAGLDAHLIVINNGRFDDKLSQLNEIEKNVTVTPFASADQKTKEAIHNLLVSVGKTNDPFALLNSAFYQEGIFIHVPKDTVVSKPFLILHINDAQDTQVISHTRLLAVVESGSSVSLIEKSNSVGEHNVFHTFTEEVIVGEGATFDYYKIQNDTGTIQQVSNTTITQSNSSKVNTFTLTLDGELIRNNLSIVIDGEQCESHFNGLYLVKGKTLVDNHTVVDHQKPNSFSNELYKGIMDENSKGVFNGKIYVRPHAQKTNAFQSNRNILMSESATINTKPQLEIWADDVKCSHGCTTGQLDGDALFYLQARGIPHDAARAMLLYAFALDVIALVKNEPLKNFLDKLITERLQNNF